MDRSLRILGMGAALGIGAFFLFKDRVEETVYNNLSFAVKKFRIKGFDLASLSFKVETDWQLTNNNVLGATLFSFVSQIYMGEDVTGTFLTNANINRSIVVPAGGTVTGTVESSLSLENLLSNVRQLIEGQQLTSVFLTGTANTSLGSFPVSKKVGVIYQ